MRCEFVVLLCVLAVNFAEEYQNVLQQLWTRDIVSKEPENKVGTHTPRYAFKPRAIPLDRIEYTNGDVRNKSEILAAGSYVPVVRGHIDERSKRAFHPRAIPLLRNEEFEGRSLDSFEEPIIEKPEGFTEAQRRSISDILGEEDEDEDESDDEDGEYEVEDVGQLERNKNKRKIKKTKKLKKYMLPLLLAYKMKYFALVPVMIAGLVLLIGATGLAGFFFALFAAVMGLQKGGY